MWPELARSVSPVCAHLSVDLGAPPGLDPPEEACSCKQSSP